MPGRRHVDARDGTPRWDTLPRSERVSAAAGFDPEVLINEGALVVATSEGGVFTLDPADPERKPVPG
ncbi:hypothetical protein SALBM311S_04771 [Streptomyces alboniger]